jgi:hypothetical protein
MHVSIGCSALVPKPGTPFARQPMAPEREIKKKLDVIRKGLSRHIDLTHESSRWSFWQAVLARGGREQARALALQHRHYGPWDATIAAALHHRDKADRCVDNRPL